jgi:hypothetical protein
MDQTSADGSNIGLIAVAAVPMLVLVIAVSLACGYWRRKVVTKNEVK